MFHDVVFAWIDGITFMNDMINKATTAAPFEAKDGKKERQEGGEEDGREEEGKAEEDEDDKEKNGGT
jgi:hypothetical protein